MGGYKIGSACIPLFTVNHLWSLQSTISASVSLTVQIFMSLFPFSLAISKTHSPHWLVFKIETEVKKLCVNVEKLFAEIYNWGPLTISSLPHLPNEEPAVIEFDNNDTKVVVVDGDTVCGGTVHKYIMMKGQQVLPRPSRLSAITRRQCWSKQLDGSHW